MVMAIAGLTILGMNYFLENYSRGKQWIKPMKKLINLISSLTALVCLTWFSSVAVSGAESAKPGVSTTKVRVLVVTGGHAFEKEPFFKLFENNQQITYQAVEHPKAQEMFRAENAGKYDVIVLYDMQAKIGETEKANFVARLNEGKGLVALHHCLCSYQNWDEYAKIIGGKYFLEKHTEKGIEKPASVYLHDVNFTVQVVDAKHPVTRGIKDFLIHDETYGGCELTAEVKPLLTTTETTSSKTIGWAHNYGKSRVVYLQLGHDHQAYENPNYIRLLAQAIRWVTPSPSQP